MQDEVSVESGRADATLRRRSRELTPRRKLRAGEEKESVSTAGMHHQGLWHGRVEGMCVTSLHREEGEQQAISAICGVRSEIWLSEAAEGSVRWDAGCLLDLLAPCSLVGHDAGALWRGHTWRSPCEGAIEAHFRCRLAITCCESNQSGVWMEMRWTEAEGEGDMK